MTDSDDELVTEYLRRLEAAASGLPADRRRELIDEITAHIAEARAADPAQPGGVRTVLDQLGSPEDIVRAADTNPGGTGLAASAGPQPPLGRPGTLEIVAVVLLLVGGLIVPVIGWGVGVVLLWVSNDWRTRDKLLGTLIWPGGLLAPLVVLAALGAVAFAPLGGVCSTSSQATVAPIGGPPFDTHHAVVTACSGAVMPPWLAITLSIIVLLASVAGPIFVAIRLLREARRPIPPVTQPGQGSLISVP